MFEVFRHEMVGGFYSWRGQVWLLASAIIFSIVSYLLLTDKELSLLDQGEALFLVAEIVIALGIFICAASGSLTISGEMEAGTFEHLMLAPVSHLKFAFEKLLYVVSLWFILYLVSIPYLVVIAAGTNLALPVVLYVGMYGTLLTIAVSAISVVVSSRLTSKSSIMAAIVLVLGLLFPSLFFSTALSKSDFGVLIENIDPVSHAMNSLDSVLVDQQALSLQLTHIWSIVIFLTFSILLFARLSRHLEVKGTE